MYNQFQSFVRKQFPVQAARVTPLNIEELAEACGGKIMHDGEKEGNFSRDYIKVRVAYPMNEEQTKARIGDWLVKQNRNFKVYKDKPFRNTFELKDGSPVLNGQETNLVEVVEKPAAPSPANMPKKVDNGKIQSVSVVEDAPQDTLITVEEAVANVQAEFPDATVIEESADVTEEKKSITLDELMTHPGDPRSTQEIMAEGQ